MKKILKLFPLDAAVLVAFMNAVFLTIAFIASPDIVVGVEALILWPIAVLGYRMLRKKTEWEIFLEKAKELGAEVIDETESTITVKFNSQYSDDMESLSKEYFPGRYKFVDLPTDETYN